MRPQPYVNTLTVRLVDICAYFRFLKEFKVVITDLLKEMEKMEKRL
jgi:gamma-glutamyl:cysteine ligase YbdK (ATP-grasp superfamily)